jgi:hypothetical protein
MLVRPAARVGCLPGTDGLPVSLAAWRPGDGPVRAVAVVEGLQDRAVSCFLPGMDDTNARVDGDAGRRQAAIAGP